MSIFGGDTGVTYEQLQRRKKVAEAMRGEAMNAAPKNVGEGLNAIAAALVGRHQQKKYDKGLGDFSAQLGADHPLIQSLAGIPKYAKGTSYHPGGPAIVGERGPELLMLPEGSQVIPNPEDQGQPPDAADFYVQPPEYELEGNRTFDDSRAYQVADSGQVKSDAYPISPSGVGEQNTINTAANAYRTLITGLNDYDRLVQEGGVSVIPGKQKDAIDVSRRNLQMQMKELYNLGVLNGPDLELMDTILLDPNGIVNKVLDLTGIADTEERVSANVKLVRKLMRDMVEPKLKSMGLKPEDVEPEAANPANMSDEDILRALGGS